MIAINGEHIMRECGIFFNDEWSFFKRMYVINKIIGCKKEHYYLKWQNKATPTEQKYSYISGINSNKAARQCKEEVKCIKQSR